MTTAREQLKGEASLKRMWKPMRKSRCHIKLVSKKFRPSKAMGGCDELPTDKEEKKCGKGKIESP